MMNSRHNTDSVLQSIACTLITFKDWNMFDTVIIYGAHIYLAFEEKQRD